MRRLSLSSPDIIRAKIHRRSTDHFMLFDGMGELAEHYAQIPCRRPRADAWVGYLSADEARERTRYGDLSLVEPSDKLLARMEQVEMPTSRARLADDVCGALPNVPAFIAGHPLNMRRRKREESAAAPLAIIADLTTSAALSAAQIATRGAAILALVRALSARRPIELWVCAMLDADNYQNCVTIAARIETTPLDLARAAFALTHAAFPRRVLYDHAHHFHGYKGQWPYGTAALTREQMEAVCAPAFSHVSETLCIPGLHLQDPLLADPIKWVEGKIAEHGAVNLDDAA